MLSKDVVKLMESLAPVHFAESWDNSGMQMGSNEKEVKKILISLDLNTLSVEKAVREKCDMIITHHPFFFGETKSLVTDGVRGNIIREIIKNDITVYSMHTNLDVAENGVSKVIGKKLGLENVSPLVKTYKDEMYKVTVYVPKEDANMLRETIGKAGGGKLGDYEYCSFSVTGEGRFKPLKGANPHIGEVGKAETVIEEKIEFIVLKSGLKKVISAMIKAHPYEEVGYDVFPLTNGGVDYGYGGFACLSESLTLLELGEIVKKSLELEDVRVYGELESKVSSVSFCGGSGASFIREASKVSDVYITGDVKYHDAQRAKEEGLFLIDAGHFGMEKHIVESLKDFFEKSTDLDIVTSTENFYGYKTL